MSLHRFFVRPEAIDFPGVQFREDQSRQMRAVLRLSSGDEVLALDGTGMEYVVRLDEVGKVARGTILSRQANSSEPGVALTLYPGLLKGAKMELVLQKCTEIGVSRFTPVVTARSVPANLSANRRSRYEAIILEAAEQSRRGIVPALEGPLPLRGALEVAAGRGRAVVLWEGEDGDRLDSLLPAGGGGELGLFIGPEGGFDEREIDDARSLGASIVTLGPRILRAETASIVGAALLLSLVDSHANRPL